MKKVRPLLKNMIKNLCFFMLLKCHYHLHPLVESERGIVDQGVEKDRSLVTFEMTLNISEPTT